MVDRTQLIAFAFEFERRLAERPEQLFQTPRAQKAPIASGMNAFDRAVTLLQTVRRHAAEHLGQAQQRSGLWRSELDAALAIYGLNTVKFSEDAYPIYQRPFALVSAGMAAARLMPDIKDAMKAGHYESLCYHVPLRQAYRQWKANERLDQADELLSSCSPRFEYAVPFVREHALIRAKLGDCGGLFSADYS